MDCLHRLLKNGIIFAISFSLALVMISCYPEFKYPLPRGPENSIDKDILGTWYLETHKGDEQQISLFPRRDGLIDIVYIYNIFSQTSVDGINVLIFEGFTTTLDKKKFMCIRFRQKDLANYEKTMKAFSIDTSLNFIVNYEISLNGDLVIKHLSTQKLIDLINERKLKGSIIKKDVNRDIFFDMVTITSDSNELATILVNENLEPLTNEEHIGTMIFSKNGN